MVVEITLALLSGISIGWLVGLSISPTVGAVIAAVLAVALSIAKTWTKQEKQGESFRDLSIIVIGVAIGATIGLYVRANDFIIAAKKVNNKNACSRIISDEDLQKEVGFWSKSGINKETVVADLYKLHISSCSHSIASLPTSTNGKTHGLAGLYASYGPICESILNAPDSEIKLQLASTQIPLFEILADTQVSNSELKVALSNFCNIAK